MAGLILKLGPNERVLINGVVMENGDRKSTLRIQTPNASILRLRDALHPDEAKTPVARAYYNAQLVVAGSADEEESAELLHDQLSALNVVFGDTPQATHVATAREALKKRGFYAVMRALKPLLAIERELLTAKPPAAQSAAQPTGGSLADLMPAADAAGGER